MKRRAHLKEAARGQHVDAYRGSGLSVAAYCQRHGMSKSTLYAWLVKAGQAAPRFVAVRSPRTVPPPMPSTRPSDGGARMVPQFRVMLGDVRVEFAQETPMAVVAGLITELARRGAEHAGA